MIVKLLSLLAIAKAVLAIPATTDIYYHEKSMNLPKAMWVFSSEGLSILSVDGTKTLKTLTAKELDCGEGCFYFDVVTDGHKYVWANAIHADPHRIDVFSLETGDYLGGVATCNTPLDVDYVVSREEVWVRCAEPADLDDPERGHMHVIQANSLGATSDEVRISEGRSYGYSTFHSSLGNYGYATSNDLNVIFKIDLANRLAVANFTMNKAYAAYDMTYSKVNKHLYIRSRVCCTCGFEGADAATCGRGPGSPGKNIQTGPSIGRTDLNGTCGVSCEGSVADTLGVLEFDTVSEKFVGSHSPLSGIGATPEASPDGQHIVLFASDGGQNLRVLRAGSNGDQSAIAFDVALDFENVPPGREAISDFAFVQWNNHDLLALASGYDNTLALVDLAASPPTVTKLTLSNADSQTGGNGGRMVEWAYGSDYLWVDASATNELYVIKLSQDGSVAKAVVERTVTNVPSSKIVYVENFAQRAEMEMLSQIFVRTDGNSDSSVDKSTSTATVEGVRNELLAEGYLDEDDDPSTIAIVALAIGVVSLILNVALLFQVIGAKITTAAVPKDEERASVTINADDKTLGSKRVT